MKCEVENRRYTGVFQGLKQSNSQNFHLSGVTGSTLVSLSIRTLRYYDKIGLLKPSAVTDSGYRLYGDECLQKLGEIMLFRELEFGLRDIKKIIENPDFDKSEALKQQIELLNLKKEHIENLIEYAEKIRKTGICKMDFKVFDSKKIENYKQEAKKQWGSTEAYREYETKTADYSKEKEKELSEKLMDIFRDFGALKNRPYTDSKVQDKVKELKNFITENYYTCTDEILLSLGQMYASGGEMTENIDFAGGKGTAKFTAKAIRIYVGKK